MRIGSRTVDHESASGAIDRQCGLQDTDTQTHRHTHTHTHAQREREREREREILDLESLARSAQYGLHTIAIQN
jgi:hypothetical protein